MKEETRSDRLMAKMARGFNDTLITELFPGIIHNLANPLNGIMGRATLMQRRVEGLLKKLTARYPDLPPDMEAAGQKILQDAGSIVSEADRFLAMFQDLTAKFSAITPREEERIDLSKLVADEMRFANFYLDFKHDVKKQIDLAEDLPEVMGDYSLFSLCFSALIRRAMRLMRSEPVKEFAVTTSRRDDVVVLSIRDTGGPAKEDGEFSDIEALLKGCGARVSLGRAGKVNEITVEIPVAGETAGKKKPPG